MRRFITVAKASEIVPEVPKRVEIQGEPIALFQINGKFYAIADECTHDGGILTGGTVEGKVITCPRHGAQFDITTGAVLRMPAFVPVQTYETRVEDGEVQILFEE
jgi:3-phenylpropionate/trans-cinnamate dioxygenase ferredoxin subunit